VEFADVEAVMSFSFNNTLDIWISQFLLGLIKSFCLIIILWILLRNSRR
jgi:hypothetical protein